MTLYYNFYSFKKISWQISITDIRFEEATCSRRSTESSVETKDISQSLFEKLFIDEIHLITKLRKNMKNYLMLLSDKILLRKNTDRVYLSMSLKTSVKLNTFAIEVRRIYY